jgi:hypothetical protein
LYGERRREFGGIGGEFVDGWVRLGANDVCGIARVVRVGLTFAGEGMEGNGLVGNVVHEKEGGAGVERDARGEGI